MMRVPALDINAQHAALAAELDAAWHRVLSHGQFVGLAGNAELQAFEREFAEFVGCDDAVGVASGTAALLLALKACDVGSGPADLVITTPFTFAATAEAIVNAGGVPVFADIDPRTLNLDPTAVQDTMGMYARAPKAILPVHLYGQPADMDALLGIANVAGAWLIEDAAQAHGATWDGKPVGTLGHLACFSFHPSKNLGALGDAGAVTGDFAGREARSADLLARVRQLRDHGRTDKYTYGEVGYGERLDALQAAFLSVKLKRLRRWNLRRHFIAKLYGERLADMEGPIAPVMLDSRVTAHARHLYVVRITDGRRDAVQAYLRERGIDANVHYPVGLHRQPAFARYAEGREFPETDRAAAEVLSLPLHPGMSEAQVDFVCETLRAALRA